MNDSKQTCIFDSVQCKNEEKAIEITKYLVENGANLKLLDEHDQNPLFYVARDGKIKLMQFLLSLGMNINDKDNFDQTPIFYAC